MTEEMMEKIFEELEAMTEEQANELYGYRQMIDKEIDICICTDEEEKEAFEKYMTIAKEKMIKWGYSNEAIEEYFENVWC